MSLRICLALFGIILSIILQLTSYIFSITLCVLLINNVSVQQQTYIYYIICWITVGFLATLSTHIMCIFRNQLFTPHVINI